MIKSLRVENLDVAIYESSQEVGVAAADFVQLKLKEAISKKNSANLILATGASQFQFLEALRERDIAWKKVSVFHLDEYKDISDTHPASFRKYLKDRILDAVKPQKIYFLNGDAEDIEHEMARYTEALKKNPIDIACIGIGENGHIAFNDPPTADFDDPKTVKLVTLDAGCRKQQLGEGWFPTLAKVPKQALTLTIPAIMNCKAVSCVVPEERKAGAVHKALHHEVTTDCPASILRKHPDARLFLDTASASKIKN